MMENVVLKYYAQHFILIKFLSSKFSHFYLSWKSFKFIFCIKIIFGINTKGKEQYLTFTDATFEVFPFLSPWFFQPQTFREHWLQYWSYDMCSRVGFQMKLLIIGDHEINSTIVPLSSFKVCNNFWINLKIQLCKIYNFYNLYLF